MNPVRFVLPLLATALAMPSLAQQVDMCVLVVQCGAGDLVLNAPLLDAIANEPQCVVAERFGGVRTQLPAPHLAGTFQVHFTAYLVCTEQQRDLVVDAIVGHVRQRLDQMLFVQPAEQCKKRREELTAQLTDLLAQRAERQGRIDAATIVGSEAAQRRNTLEQLVVTTRIDLATQKRAQEQLDKLRAQHAALREDLRAEEQHLGAERNKQMLRCNQIEVKLRDLPDPAKMDTTKVDEVKRLRAAHDDASAALAAVNQRYDAAREKAADVQRMLSVVLEQLPATMLDLQRAQARLDALAAEQQQLHVLADAAGKARTEAAHFDTQAERLSIQISVTKTMLTEVEGKVARLQPVRYELLRRRG